MTDVFVNIGDTVHIADTQPTNIARAAGIQSQAVESPPSVEALLASARAAHQRFQKASGHNGGRQMIMPDGPAAAIAVREALDARVAAERADPERIDPAWAEDVAAMRVSSETLTAFYRDYFAPDVKL